MTTSRASSRSSSRSSRSSFVLTVTSSTTKSSISSRVTATTAATAAVVVACLLAAPQPDPSVALGALHSVFDLALRAVEFSIAVRALATLAALLALSVTAWAVLQQRDPDVLTLVEKASIALRLVHILARFGLALGFLAVLSMACRVPSTGAAPPLHPRPALSATSVPLPSCPPREGGGDLSLESVSRGVCAGGAVRREQERENRETVRRESACFLVVKYSIKYMPSNRAWDSRGHFHCTFL